MEQTPYNTDVEGNASCLKANYYKMAAANFISHTKDEFKATCVIEEDEPQIVSYTRSRENDSIENYHLKDITNTIHGSTGQGGNTDSYIAEPLRILQATEQGYVEVPEGSVFDGSYPNSKTRRGRLQDGGKVTPTITANGEPLNYYEGKKESNYRIRKLTERECFRLMGVSETNIDKIQASGVSRSQQYKMAGNSIVVDVLEHIFRKMFVDTHQESQQLSLF